MSGKFLQGAVSRGLREAGAALRDETMVSGTPRPYVVPVSGTHQLRSACGMEEYLYQGNAII
jgi:hypothetical protein